jgi:hypothetical protein
MGRNVFAQRRGGGRVLSADFADFRGFGPVVPPEEFLAAFSCFASAVSPRPGASIPAFRSAAFRLCLLRCHFKNCRLNSPPRGERRPTKVSSIISPARSGGEASVTTLVPPPQTASAGASFRRLAGQVGGQGGQAFVGAKTAWYGSREFWYGSWYGSDLKNPQCLCGLVRMYGSGRVEGGISWVC